MQEESPVHASSDLQSELKKFLIIPIVPHYHSVFFYWIYLQKHIKTSFDLVSPLGRQVRASEVY